MAHRMSKTISARIDNALHNKLKDVCNNEGITINDKLKQIIHEKMYDLNENIEKKTEIQEKQFELEAREKNIRDLKKYLGINDSSQTKK